ncbi:hypothetical protein Uis1B_1761 [Bifidobacterium margollesii]|uniref:Uncharacterized protein n=1 Tax=Bifidobacterium margollesii TaxID=2020964 RepID=A0A2N5J847_9BIFI|nr:hypothetical protein Uis1B_1761 [Bifidobacterium margollesii]
MSNFRHADSDAKNVIWGCGRDAVGHNMVDRNMAGLRIEGSHSVAVVRSPDAFPMPPDVTAGCVDPCVAVACRKFDIWKE